MASRALETLSRLTALVVGFVAMPTPAVRDDHGARDDERGLSQLCRIQYAQVRRPAAPAGGRGRSSCDVGATSVA